MRRARAFPPLTDLRLARLRAGLTLMQVCAKAGLPLTRGSKCERDLGTPEDCRTLREAAEALLRERKNEADERFPRPGEAQKPEKA